VLAADPAREARDRGHPGAVAERAGGGQPIPAERRASRPLHDHPLPLRHDQLASRLRPARGDTTGPAGWPRPRLGGPPATTAARWSQTCGHGRERADMRAIWALWPSAWPWRGRMWPRGHLTRGRVTAWPCAAWPCVRLTAWPVATWCRWWLAIRVCGRIVVALSGPRVGHAFWSTRRWRGLSSPAPKCHIDRP
jgi:hypothetical protein